MTLLLVASLVYVLNAHKGPKGPKGKGRCQSDTSYGDASMSNCGAAEDILNKIYQGAVDQNIQTPQEAAAYTAGLCSQSFRTQTVEGNVLNTGFQEIAGHIFFEAKILKSKAATDIQNVRYGPNFVAVDYKLEVVNVCDFGVSDVQATAIIVCDNPDGLVSDINIVRDMSKLAPFMQNSLVCAQQIGLYPSGSAGGAALSEFASYDMNIDNNDNNNNYYSLQLSSSQMTMIECIFGLIIICNIILLCQCAMRNNKKKTKYATVNYLESDTDAL